MSLTFTASALGFSIDDVAVEPPVGGALGQVPGGQRGDVREGGRDGVVGGDVDEGVRWSPRPGDPVH